MRLAMAAIVLLTSIGAAASTIDNDDSCDISLLPAATLLLPYFEIDFDPDPYWGATSENTIFTITNVGQLPQIARVSCSAPVGLSEANFGGSRIGPAPNRRN